MKASFNGAFNEVELVEQARADSSGFAMQELLQRVSGFIMSKAKQFASTEQDKQDFYQEGLVGFVLAVHAFKPGMGASFNTFACTCALNRMKNLLKQRSAGEQFSLVSLEQTDQSGGCTEGPEASIQAVLEAENIIEAISHNLSHYERKVLLLHLQGENYRQIAEKTGKTVKSTDNALQRIRRKLRPEVSD